MCPQRKKNRKKKPLRGVRSFSRRGSVGAPESSLLKETTGCVSEWKPATEHLYIDDTVTRRTTLEKRKSRREASASGNTQKNLKSGRKRLPEIQNERSLIVFRRLFQREYLPRSALEAEGRGSSATQKRSLPKRGGDTRSRADARRIARAEAGGNEGNKCPIWWKKFSLEKGRGAIYFDDVRGGR